MTSDGQPNSYKCKEKFFQLKEFAVDRGIDILAEFYVKEGGRGPWDLLGHIAVNNYLNDLVPRGLTKAADARWILREMRRCHSSMKSQRKSSRIQRREYNLTTGKEVSERSKVLPKLAPLVGPAPENARMTRSGHRFFMNSDPSDMTVYCGDLSCHIWNCANCSKGSFLECNMVKSGVIGPWIPHKFVIKQGDKRRRD